MPTKTRSTPSAAEVVNKGGQPRFEPTKDQRIAVSEMAGFGIPHEDIFALYPEKLNPDVNPAQYERVFPNLRAKSRGDRKVMLRAVIGASRGDLDLMRDPRTDPRPLVIPAA